MTEAPRVLIWWSTGAASYAAAKLALRQHPEALLVRCDTNNEDVDNYRFEEDACRRLNRDITVIRSSEYKDVWDVWTRRKFIAGRKGAPCTSEMKIAPRVAFQRPHDLHVFGYTADRLDALRYKRMTEAFFELHTWAPLIDHGVTKFGALAIVERDGLELPRSYAMGFPNANCLETGCGKATDPKYWALFRQHFPHRFYRTAELSRKLGARLTRINGERCFIDQIPDDHPTLDPIAPACVFLCAATDWEAEE